MGEKVRALLGREIIEQRPIVGRVSDANRA